MSQDDLAAWRQQTRGTFSLRMFPGDHFFVTSARADIVQALSHDLQLALSQTLRVR